MRTASSTPHSSCGEIVKPRCCVSIACSSSVSTIFPPVIGTRFTQTEDPHALTLAFSGSKTGVESFVATVTG